MTLSSDGTGWNTALIELAAKHAAEDPHSNRYYYGVVNPNYTSGVVGLGYVGAPTAIGWDKDISGSTLAHEEGHNMGDEHSPCGGAGNPDPNYPYAGGVIGVSGWDAFAASGNFKPITDHDLMGYCSNIWISDYVYKNELNYRLQNDPIVPADIVRADSNQEGLLVWGHIENGKVFLEPAFRIAVPRVAPRSGAYHWEARDAQGQVLGSTEFDAHGVADLPDGTTLESFSFVVPIDTAALDNLKSLHVLRNGVELTRATASVALAAASGTSLPVRVESLANHAVQLSWDGKAYPVLMIRDAKTGEVRGFARGGSAVLLNMPGALEVHYSNGVRSDSVHFERLFE
jgi:hypothetical protein